MSAMRIFVSYESVDAAFATRLMTDLRQAGAEVITDNVGLEGTTFERFLSEQLPLCRYLILVQTVASLQSPHVRSVVDSALTLVQEGRMSAVFRVIAPDLNGVTSQAIPLRWANTPEFDASQDYARTSFRLCLKLELNYTKPIPDAPPPAFTLPVLETSNPEGTKNMLPFLSQAHAQASMNKDRPKGPIKQTYTPLSRRFIIPIIMVVCVLAGGLFLTIQRATTQATRPPTQLRSPAQPGISAQPTGSVQLKSSAQPAFTVFKSQSYMAWTGTDKHLSIAKSSTGNTFTSPTTLSETSAHGPGLAVYNNQLYMAWISADNSLHIASSSNGSTFTPPTRFGTTGIQGPALTVYNNQLFVVWIGMDKRFYVTTSNDGSTFASPASLPVSSEKAPALTVYNNQLYMAWIATDNSLHVIRFLNNNTYTGVDTPGASHVQGVAFAVSNKQLYVAWTNMDQGSRISIAKSSTGTVFDSPTLLTQTSPQGPALTVYNNQLYMAWIGADQRLNPSTLEKQ